MSRRSRSMVIVAVLAALVAPVLANRDSFPLSTYPMYARTRGAEVSFVTAQGIAADGTIVPLTLGTIGASDDPLVVAAELRDVVRLDEADSRCRVIAARVLNRSDADFADVEAVEVVTERHDTVTSLEGDDSLRDRTVHARCAVTT